LKDEILNYFQVLKKRGIIGTSYLFIGKGDKVIVDVAKLISCDQEEGFCNSCWDCKRIEQGNHPDLFVIEPDGFSIKIEAIREGMRFFSLKSFRIKRRL